jgi:uncharacterized protein YjbI with pentapeptide repeats
MATWTYEYSLDPRGSVESGEVVAENEDEARRKVRILLATARLPQGIKLANLTTQRAAEAKARSARMRILLHTIAAHHAWLKGEADGERANLRLANLAGVSLRRMDLSDAEMTEADLSGADLRGALLRRARLSRANLEGANLTGADLREVDLSDADLRNADLSDADLTGADLWRANLMGARISPQALHRALQCRK